MQSLQADQSLYNRKGVCYILFNTWSFPGWQEYYSCRDCKDKHFLIIICVFRQFSFHLQPCVHNLP